MSLQERTLVIKNFDPERTTGMLLKELCLQGGPVRNVVVKPDHAFVEFEDMESVGYSKALLEGVELFGKRLVMEPKIRYPGSSKYNKMLEEYIRLHKQRERMEQLQKEQQAMMMSHYNQQQTSIQPPLQQAPIGHPQPFLNPSQSIPNYYVQQPPAPVINYNYNPFNSHQQSLFIDPNHHQMPSTSFQGNHNNLQRSRSFNHSQPRHRDNNSNGRNRRRR